MSPEYKNRIENKSETALTAKKIESLLAERYDENTLTDPREGCVFESSQKTEPMASAVNRAEGVTQHLVCLVKAGNEFFSVIDSTISESHDASSKITETVLARHVVGGRSEFIGLVAEGGIALIGRSAQNDLDSTVSRKHFAVAKSKDGSIAIADLGSTNHTKVYRQESASPLKLDDSDVDNPLNNLAFWSVKSAVVKHSIGAARSAE